MTSFVMLKEELESLQIIGTLHIAYEQVLNTMRQIINLPKNVLNQLEYECLFQ